MKKPVPVRFVIVFSFGLPQAIIVGNGDGDAVMR